MAPSLNVTHSRQETETGCLVACVQMALSYLGISRSQDELAQVMCSVPHVGTIGRNVLNLQSPTVQVTYTQGSLEWLRTWINQGVPVITLVQTAELPYWAGVEAQHAVVVVGLDDDNVHVLDPARGPEILSVLHGDFLLAWEDWMDGCCVIIKRVETG